MPRLDLLGVGSPAWYGFMCSALVWAVTILAVPAWWASPAFDAMGLSPVLAALLWASAAALLVRSAVSGSRFTEAAALAAYSVPTISTGCSIVWFTLQENNVAAMGSAVAWLTLGATSLVRSVALSRGGEA